VTAWHALSVDDVLRKLKADPSGLGSEEAARRLDRYGPNSLRIRKPVSAWAIFKHQLASVVAWLLVVATGVALAIGDTIEAVAIGVVLAINVTVGFWTEWRARLAVDALGRLQAQEAEVLRDGGRVNVEASELVPGDVVVLSEGARVPADARLLEASELQVDEALLTGESMPVPKSVEAVDEERPGETGVGDRTSMVFKSTTVTRGAGTAVVVATGTATEIGKIGELVGSLEHAPTPIERRLDVLGRRLIWITLGVALLVIAVGLMGDRDPWLVVETGLALAIAAVPEGLPVVATITLAVGMWRMAQRNALVRRPPAVEALGSATVVCADKTGTLTSGRMSVTSLLAGEGRVDVEDGAEPSEGFHQLVRSVVLANEGRLERVDEGWEGVGDPTDVALLRLGAELGMDRPELLSEIPEVARLPFSSARMLMASFHRGNDGPVAIHVKGATDRVLPLCEQWMGAEGVEPIDEALRGDLHGHEEELAAEGLRVLAVATGTTDEGGAGNEDALQGLTLLGFVGLMDPPAEGVEETIASFRAAGIRVLMITGDQPATARSIAERLGMLEPGARVVRGSELSRMDEAELRQVVGEVSVFGRVSPEDKLRIVEALLDRGEVVGMLGDGVNDAPALKRADIGVAMGLRGTDVAKEVADLVLADDRLQTVGVAVEEGRVIFDNIRKFVFYLFSCNLSEVAIVLGASLAGAPLPLLPLQLLWLNVVTDVFPALALSAEPAESDVMRRPPRPRDAPILSRGLLTYMGAYAALMTLSTLGVFWWALTRGPDTPGYAVTMSFMTLAMAQLAHALNARRFGPLRWTSGRTRNRWMVAALLLGVALQLLAVYVPALQRVLGTVALGTVDWTIVVGAALLPLVVGQIWKRAHAHASRNDSSAAREAAGRSS
jgi:P-type Ca2+ transporter type 2C